VAPEALAQSRSALVATPVAPLAGDGDDACAGGSQGEVVVNDQTAPVVVPQALIVSIRQ
jgi:hypothetical protein